MLKSISLGFLSALSILFYSCKQDSEVAPIPSNTTSTIASASTSDGLYKIKILSPKPFVIGHNEFQVELIKNGSGELIHAEEIGFIPTMQMPAMIHSAFSEKIEPQRFGVVFLMPSETGMDWNLEFSIRLSGGAAYDVNVPVLVLNANYSHFTQFQNPIDSSYHFLCIANAADFRVGSNDLDLLIFKRASMMDWPEVEDLVVSFNPSMPAMGHGSPNNIDPIHLAQGHYLGKVNFTMTGLWRLDFEIFSQGVKIGDSYIEVDLK